MSICSILCRRSLGGPSDTHKSLLALSWFALCLSTIVLIVVTVTQVTLVYTSALQYEIQIVVLFFSSLFHFFMTVFITLLVLTKLKPETPEIPNTSDEPQNITDTQIPSAECLLDSQQRPHNLQAARADSVPPAYDRIMWTPARSLASNHAYENPSMLRGQQRILRMNKEPLSSNTYSFDSFSNVSTRGSIRQGSRTMDGLDSDVTSEWSNDNKDPCESSDENDLRKVSSSLMRRLKELKNNPAKLNRRENEYANLPYAMANMGPKQESIDKLNSRKNDCSRSEGNLYPESKHGFAKASPITESSESNFSEAFAIVRERKRTSENLKSSQFLGLNSRVDTTERMYFLEKNLSEPIGELNSAAKPVARKFRSWETTSALGKSTPNLNREYFLEDETTIDDCQLGANGKETKALNSSFRNSNLRKSEAALYQASSRTNEILSEDGIQKTKQIEDPHFDTAAAEKIGALNKILRSSNFRRSDAALFQTRSQTGRTEETVSEDRIRMAEPDYNSKIETGQKEMGALNKILRNSKMRRSEAALSRAQTCKTEETSAEDGTRKIGSNDDSQLRAVSEENGASSSILKNSSVRGSDAALDQAKAQIRMMNERLLEQYARKTRMAPRHSSQPSFEQRDSPKRLSAIEETTEGPSDPPEYGFRI